MNRDDLAYDPAITIYRVIEIKCDGGCGYRQIEKSAHKAEAAAEEHRQWHHRIIGALESEGTCSSCGRADTAPKLAEGRYGGLPFLYCGTCGADW
jgi:hypothetical protein